MLGKSRIALFFQWFVVPDVRRSRLAKAAGAGVAVQQRNEKSHAFVARSTFASQNAQNTTAHRFCHLRCRKIAHRCGPKHIFKSNAKKHFGSNHLQKWHAAVARSTFASQNAQNTSARGRFCHLRCRKLARRCGADTFASQNVQNTCALDLKMSKKCLTEEID